MTLSSIVSAGGLRVHVRGGSEGFGRGDGPLIVLLHGYGASGQDLVGLYDAFEWPRHYRFAFAEAPLEVPHFPEGRMWWPVELEMLQRATWTRQYELITEHHPRGIVDVRGQLARMLDDLKQELGAPARGELFIGGFSQGAATACDLAFLDASTLSGLIVMSGTFFCKDVWIPAMPNRRGLPAFVSHGTQDPVVPFVLAERLRDEMTKAGLTVDWQPFEGGHGIPGPTLAALAQFVATCLRG